MPRKTLKLIFSKIGIVLDWLCTYILIRADKWYVKSNWPKLLKEFIFLFLVLPATLIGDLATWFLKHK